MDWQSLLEAMRALNYIEGQNLVVNLALAEGRPERLPGLIADLVRAKVDVIVTTYALVRSRAPRAPLLVTELLE